MLLNNNWAKDLLPHLASYEGVRLDKREGNCAAIPICEFIGNARQGCYDNGSTNMRDICIVSIIMLLARLQGITIEEGEIKEPEPKEIGFKPQGAQEEEG